jgi:hypothetical protein
MDEDEPREGDDGFEKNLSIGWTRNTHESRGLAWSEHIMIVGVGQKNTSERQLFVSLALTFEGPFLKLRSQISRGIHPTDH